MSQDDDLLTALVGGDPQSADKIKAIVAQLRGSKQISQLAQLSGDPTLAPFGQRLQQQDQQNEVELGRNAMQNRSDVIRDAQVDRQTRQGDATLAETIRYHDMLDQERKDRLAQQKAAQEAVGTHQDTIDKIARYELPLPSRYSKNGQALIDAVAEQHPEYDATMFAKKQQAQRDFGSGKEGNLLRGADVTVQHLDTASDLADQLHNTQYPVVNMGINAWKSFKGSPEIKAFNTAKQLVSDEVDKFILGGGGGALADRKALQDQISAADNPAALKTVIGTLRTLMGGQMQGLQNQYNNAVGDGKFLVNRDGSPRFNPRTMEIFGLGGAPQSALPGARAAAGQPPGMGSGPPPPAPGSGPGGGALAGPSGAPGAAPGSISPIEATLRQQTGFQGDGTPAPPTATVDSKGIVRTGRRNGKRVGQLADGTIVPLE